jgi:glycosyltransferase WbpL
MREDFLTTVGRDHSLLWAGIAAFLAGLVFTSWARGAALRWGMLDHPNARSSHGRPIPRTGGVAMLCATLVGLAAGSLSLIATPAHVAFLGCLAGVAALGFWDDRRGLSPFLRLGLQTAMAAAFVGFAGGLQRFPLPPPLDLPMGWLGTPLAVLWIVAVVNFYNFIDGIDGLAGLQAVVTGFGLAVLGFDPLASVLGMSLVGASLGFLAHNWSPARIFLGDAGSGLLGFAFAALPLLAPREPRSATVLFVALSLWFFLADAVFTLTRRVARGDRWYEAHREHLYQRLVHSGLSHAFVAAGLCAAAALVTIAALSSWGGPVVALGLAALLFGGEVVLVLWRTRHRPAQTAAVRGGDAGLRPS